MQSIYEILTVHGIDLTGWTLGSASGISADGFTIAGTGKNPDGNAEAWIANLETNSHTVPEPATMLLLSSVLIGLLGYKRKFRN